jgi:hypothetical protein
MMLKKILAAAFALLLTFSGQPQADQARVALFSGCPLGAAVYFDFTTGHQCGSVGVTTTRASVGYIDDTAGNWTQVPANTLRRSDKGALIEEARTNSIRNNSMQGAAVSGAIPTNWSPASGALANGITRTVVGLGTENGIEYIDLRFAGTTSTAAGTSLSQESSIFVAALNGQSWTYSFFNKLVGGDLTNVGNITAVVSERDGAGAALATSTTIVVPTSSWQRTSTSRTFNNASTAFVLGQIGIAMASGVAVDFTLRIGWPQLELGAFVTSPIRTTTAAATRAADVVSLTSPPAFGPSFSAYGKGTTNIANTPGTSPRLLSLNTGSGVNVAEIGVDRTNGKVFDNLVVASVNQYNSSYGSSVLSLPVAVAMALADGDQRWAVAGTLGTARTASPIFTPTNVVLGAQVTSAQWNGYIQRVALWPNSRLSNAQLQALTR